MARSIPASRYSKRNRREALSVFVIIVLAVVMFFPIAGVLMPARAATNHVIDMYNYYFSPQFITIASGDTVQWHNTASITHTAKSNTSAWTEVLVSAGATSPPLTLNLADGDYLYICSIHFPIEPTMWGKITVSSTGIPEFSSSLVVVLGMLAIALGLMLIRPEQ